MLLGHPRDADYRHTHGRRWPSHRSASCLFTAFEATRHALFCRDERLTVSVGSHPVSRGVLVDGPTLLVSLLADAPNSEEPTVVRCAVRLFVLRVLL